TTVEPPTTKRRRVLRPSAPWANGRQRGGRVWSRRRRRMAATILVVDDEPDIRSTLRFNLEREGFRTVMADSGRAALQLARSGDPRPDLVVLDLMLPDISGTDVCRELRQGSDTRRIPILMLTAKTDAIDRVVGFEVGADDYVTKPFSPRELVLRIKAI